MIFRVPTTIWILCKLNLMILTRVTPTLLPLEVNGINTSLKCYVCALRRNSTPYVLVIYKKIPPGVHGVCEDTVG